MATKAVPAPPHLLANAVRVMGSRASLEWQFKDKDKRVEGFVGVEDTINILGRCFSFPERLESLGQAWDHVQDGLGDELDQVSGRSPPHSIRITYSLAVSPPPSQHHHNTRLIRPTRWCCWRTTQPRWRTSTT